MKDHKQKTCNEAVFGNVPRTVADIRELPRGDRLLEPIHRKRLGSAPLQVTGSNVAQTTL